MDKPDIVNLLRDKSALIKFLLNAIMASQKNAVGLCSMKQNGWTQAGMLDKVIEVTAIQSKQIQTLSLIALLMCTSRDFDTMVAEMMMKMGRGDEALKAMFEAKMNGVL